MVRGERSKRGFQFCFCFFPVERGRLFLPPTTTSSSSSLRRARVHDRLLGFRQRRWPPRRRVGPVRGPGAAHRRRPQARRAPHPVPRPGRHRGAGRGPDPLGDSVAAARDHWRAVAGDDSGRDGGATVWGEGGEGRGGGRGLRVARAQTPPPPPPPPPPLLLHRSASAHSTCTRRPCSNRPSTPHRRPSPSFARRWRRCRPPRATRTAPSSGATPASSTSSRRPPRSTSWAG